MDFSVQLCKYFREKLQTTLYLLVDFFTSGACAYLHKVYTSIPANGANIMQPRTRNMQRIIRISINFEFNRFREHSTYQLDLHCVMTKTKGKRSAEYNSILHIICMIDPVQYIYAIL